MTDDDLIKVLDNPFLNGRENHYISDCPFCGKEGHLFVNRHKAFQKSDNRFIGSWDCKGCKQNGNIHKLLAKFNKLHILDGEPIDIHKQLEKKLILEAFTKEESNLVLPDKKLPIGFKRVNQDDYLIERGFTEREFEKYIIGETKISRKFREYVIISIEESRKCKGFLGRSKLSKERIDRINKKYKLQGVKKKFLRYRNSINTEFSKLLLGYDEVMFTTDLVVLVEGYFDKVRVDQALKLDYSDEIKCCATFGSSVSDDQILKLQRRGVTKAILVYDSDMINVSKSYSFRLKEDFEDVQVGYTGEKDLGDSSFREIIGVFDNLKTPQEYQLNMVQKRKLS